MSDVREDKLITYYDCSSALLKMWMDNVITDTEYYQIIAKLNQQHDIKDE